LKGEKRLCVFIDNDYIDIDFAVLFSNDLGLPEPTDEEMKKIEDIHIDKLVDGIPTYKLLPSLFDWLDVKSVMA